MCRKLAQGEEERRVIPAASIAVKSFLAEFLLLRIKSASLSDNGWQGKVGMLWQTECFGSASKKPLEETTSE